MFYSPGDNNNNDPGDGDGLTGGGVQRTLLISDCDIVKEEEIRIILGIFLKGNTETHPVITILPAAYPACRANR